MNQPLTRAAREMGGLGYWLAGLRLMWQPGLRRFTLIPLFINTLLFGLAGWLLVSSAGDWVEGLLPEWLDFLYWLLMPIVVLGLLLVTFFTFTLVANLIAAPFNAVLAARVEAHLTGRSPPEDDQGLIADAVGAIASEVGRLLYLAAWAIPLVILWFIPGLNLIAPFAWFIFSAWMMSLEYIDNPAGNHGLSFREQRRCLRQRPALTLGFGSLMTLMTMVPVANFLAMPVGVCGATRMWVEGFEGKAVRRES
ncbi:sulfate transporter CysZ [Guyparkeria halophila]|uniref:Sulfate transporter CysZ n=1 Tax=Guyparkeria halophila TaxID=47960 RepID=A0ABZ0YWP0_9GAMM|nr:sulfate transporter CysZ [Guyparkeria halophila]WQH16574.1 sulfate transporter CysZ [Guyparkeria halophila]